MSNETTANTGSKPAHFLHGAALKVGSATGMVVDASGELVAVFPTTSEPIDMPSLGVPTKAHVSIDERRAPLKLDVTPVRRIDARAGVTLIAFWTHQLVPRAIAAAGYDVRGETRVSPAGISPMVTITKDTTVAYGTLHDVSMSGIGVLADAQADRLLTDIRRVTLLTTLADGEDPVEIDARIQNRRLRDDGKIIYGLRFLTEPGSRSPLALVRYVLKRQGEG